MAPAAPSQVRCVLARVLRRGLCPALRTYLPTEPVETYHVAHRCRTRRFTPLVTVWALVHQTLTHASDAATSQSVAAWLGLDIAARSGSYAKARERLPQALLDELTRGVTPRRRRRGRRWFILDGTGCAAADTPANQRSFPQPPGQRAGCGFPVLRLVVLLDADTGAVVDWAIGDLNTSEAELASRLWDRLPAGSVVLADRGFASYAFLAAMAARGVDVVVRQHDSRHNQRPSRRCRDWTETWLRPSEQQPWWDPQLVPSLPVRVVWQRLPSGRWLKLNTTLSRRQLGAAALARAYRRRWRIETQLAALKVGLRLEPLAAQRPDLVVLRLTAALLALNLVCAVRADAARERGLSPWRVSFASVVGALLASLLRFGSALRGARGWVLAQCTLNPERPGRHEPRVLKRRPKDFPRMTAPRHAHDAQIALGRA